MLFSWIWWLVRLNSGIVVLSWFYVIVGLCFFCCGVSVKLCIVVCVLFRCRLIVLF